MARLHTRPSSSSDHSRDSSILRDLSDQENRDPQARKDDPNLTRPRKRKRGKTPVILTRTPPEEEEEEDEEGEDNDVQKFNRYYDPDQKQDDRRQVTRESRALEREFNENRDEYMRDTKGSRLKATIHRADHVFRNIRQTNDATLDSRLLVNVSDLAYKKSAQLVLGDTSTGVDVDLFLSKCITFMRTGGSITNNELRPTGSQQRPAHAQDYDGDDREDVADELDWGVLGQHACFPYNARPPVPSFLLGPLSVQKKQRVLTQRRSKQAKDNSSREARPEALTREDLSQSDENTLTSICGRIRDHLDSHIKRADDASTREGFTQDEDLNSDRVQAFFKRYRVSSTGGPSLFDYAINPHSFGQTVENMFYISFLIKDGAVGVYPDSDGLPSLLVSEARPVNTMHAEDVHKHQAVFAIDYATWQDLVKAFDIRVSLIPHREEESATQIGSRGWYT